MLSRAPNRTTQTPQSRRPARRKHSQLVISESYFRKHLKELWAKGNVQLTPIMICLEKVSIAASIPLKWKGIGFALDETEYHDIAAAHTMWSTCIRAACPCILLLIQCEILSHPHQGKFHTSTNLIYIFAHLLEKEIQIEFFSFLDLIKWQWLVQG